MEKNLGKDVVTRLGDSDPDDLITVVKDLAKDLHNALDNSEIVIKKIVDNAVSLTEADFACIYLLDEYNQTLECRNSDYCKFDKKIINQGCSFELVDNEDNLVVKIFKPLRQF